MWPKLVKKQTKESVRGVNHQVCKGSVGRETESIIVKKPESSGARYANIWEIVDSGYSGRTASTILMRVTINLIICC